MDSLLPIHNALVHVPIGLALVLPAMAAVLALAAWRSERARHAWAALVVVEAALLLGALLALRSGERAEEGAEKRGVAESRIEEHEERAGIFSWIAGAALASSVAAFGAMRTKAKGPLVLLATLATLPVAAGAAWTGLAGGEIAHPEGETPAPPAHEHSPSPPAEIESHEEHAAAGPVGTVAEDVAPRLPERLRAALTAEMTALQASVPKAVASLASGDWESLASTADAIAGSELLAQQLTHEEHEALHASMPPAFLQRDRAFHDAARALATAAREHDATGASEHLGALVSSCAGCHAQHAPTKFPGLR